MAEYRISGYWKGSNNEITHYAVHTIYERTITKAERLPKAEVIRLLESGENTAATWTWDYSNCSWLEEEPISVVQRGFTKFLRSNADNQKTDSLSHLINYDWI